MIKHLHQEELQAVSTIRKGAIREGAAHLGKDHEDNVMLFETSFRFDEGEVPPPEKIHHRLCEHTGLVNFAFDVEGPRKGYTGKSLYRVCIRHSKFADQYVEYEAESDTLVWRHSSMVDHFDYLEWAFMAVVQDLGGRLQYDDPYDIPDWAMKKWDQQRNE